MTPRRLLPVSLLLLLSCSPPAADPFLRPVYDKAGKLEQLQYDSNKNGKVDTWSHMDGARLLRIEIDKDEDGKIDRWEYYDAAQKLEKVGLSRANDGKVDAWAYSTPDGAMGRLEISTRRDGKVSRVEFFEAGRRVRAEEDGDEDGRVDKWETYRDGSLASVALDSTRRGVPDRRLLYAPDGTVIVETDPAGTGSFKPAKSGGGR